MKEEGIVIAFALLPFIALWVALIIICFIKTFSDLIFAFKEGDLDYIGAWFVLTFAAFLVGYYLI